jgi:hypothetical protein
VSGSGYDEFKSIPGFPDYMINAEWEIRNAKTGRLVQRDHGENLTIKLYAEDGVQYHRSIRKLHALAFGKSHE